MWFAGNQTLDLWKSRLFTSEPSLHLRTLIFFIKLISISIWRKRWKITKASSVDILQRTSFVLLCAAAHISSKSWVQLQCHHKHLWQDGERTELHKKKHKQKINTNCFVIEVSKWDGIKAPSGASGDIRRKQQWSGERQLLKSSALRCLRCSTREPLTKKQKHKLNQLQRPHLWIRKYPRKSLRKSRIPNQNPPKKIKKYYVQ